MIGPPEHCENASAVTDERLEFLERLRLRLRADAGGLGRSYSGSLRTTRSTAPSMDSTGVARRPTISCLWLQTV
jgi:hypothetical protein